MDYWTFLCPQKNPRSLGGTCQDRPARDCVFPAVRMGRRRISPAFEGRRPSVLKANPFRVKWWQDNLDECGPQSLGGKRHALSELMKRKSTIAALVLVSPALLALFLLVKGRECRIRWDVGIINSPFADYNGSDAAAPDTDVAVAYLSTHDRNRLFTRFVWSLVNQQSMVLFGQDH